MKKLGMWLMLTIFGTVASVLPVGATQTTTEESVDAAAVMQQAAQATQAVRTLGLETSLYGVYMDVAVDMNTKVIYMNLSYEGDVTTIWADVQANREYIYTSDYGKYYYKPCDQESFDDLLKDQQDLQQTDTNINDGTYTYSYVGKTTRTVKNQATECYQIHGVPTAAGSTETAEYYVSTESKRLISVDIKDTAGTNGLYSETMTMNYYYPDALTVPAEVSADCTIAPDYTVTKGKVSYTVKYVKGKPVVGVSYAKDAKSIKIPDSVTIAGQQYPVYEIGAFTFSGNTKLRSVTIGGNVQVIGKKAFYGCEKLQKVTIRSKKLRKVGKQALKHTAKSLRVQAPKGKLAKYRKWLRSAGADIK